MAVALPLAVEMVELVFALRLVEIEVGRGMCSDGQIIVRAGIRMVRRGCRSTTGEAETDDVRPRELVDACVPLRLRVDVDALTLATLAVGEK